MTRENGTRPVEAESHRVEYAAIYRIKAAAIFAVMFTHAGVPPWDPRWSAFDQALRTTWVSFHVPSFLFASGFLYWRSHPISIGEVGDRLRRILPPYLVASIVALLVGPYKVVNAQGLLFALATGSVVGVYYYIFLIATLTPLIWILSRTPVAVTCVALAALITYFAVSIAHPAVLPAPSWFWGLRNPLYVAHFFLAGWIVRDRIATVRDFGMRHRRWLVTAAVVTIGAYLAFVAQLRGQQGAGLLARAAYTAAVVGLIAAAWPGSSTTAITRWIANATFTLYLYHPLVSGLITPMAQQLPASIRVFAIVGAEFLGAAALILIGRLLLRQHSRTWIGA